MVNAERSLPRRAIVRGSVALLLGAAWWTVAPKAWAGSYLDRAQILSREARTEADYLERRLDSKELAELVHALAASRLAAAHDMMVPKEVVEAHPHLLLMLENYERASDAAATGGRQRFMVFQQRARDEEEIFRSIMRQLGFPLEGDKKKK